MAFLYSPPICEPDIVFADRDIVIVNKPSGLLSVPGRAEDHKDCLQSRLEQGFAGIRVVHRLDMDTSGIMVFALNADSHRHLSKQFEVKTTKKTYICLVEGELSETSGTIDLPLRCDWPNRPLQMVDHEQGKKACTHWKMLQCSGGVSRLELTPITGRSHQLRVHCLSIGHPILGDRFYAPEEVVTKAKRLCLHAQALTILHPTSGQEMTFSKEADF